MLDLNKVFNVLQKQLTEASQEAIRPIADNVEYEAGRRVGVAQGVQRCMAAITHAITDDENEDDKL